MRNVYESSSKLNYLFLNTSEYLRVAFLCDLYIHVQGFLLLNQINSFRSSLPNTWMICPYLSYRSVYFWTMLSDCLHSFPMCSVRCRNVNDDIPMFLLSAGRSRPWIQRFFLEISELIRESQTDSKGSISTTLSQVRFRLVVVYSTLLLQSNNGITSKP